MPPQALLAVWILGLTLARASRRGKEDLLDVAQGLKSPKLTDLIGQSVMKNSYVNYYSRKENWNAFFYSKTWMPMNVSPPHPSLHVATEMMQKKNTLFAPNFGSNLFEAPSNSALEFEAPAVQLWFIIITIILSMLILYDIMLSILIYCPVILQETERLRHKRRMTLVTLQVQIWWKSFVHISEGYPCNLSSLSLMRSKEGTCERTRINGAKRLNQTY